MLKTVPFANAAAVVTALLYIICAAWVYISKDSFIALFGTWFHGFDLASLPFAQLNLGSLMFGLITAAIAAWIVSYAFVWLYNRLAR